MEGEDFGTRMARRMRRILPGGGDKDAIVPVVRLSGTIGIGTPFRPALTLSGVNGALERAFNTKDAREVALVINSPGGAAAQAHLIYRRIRSLAEEKNLPVTAFVEDVAASGGYMIACAADEIVADEASIVGSIGVVTQSFGFDKLLEKIGVDRRVYATSDKKTMLDPFQPEKPEDVKRIKALQSDVQALFTKLVQERRSGRLVNNKNLYTGEFWVGTRAHDLGLIDAIGDLHTTLRARYGEDLDLRVMGEKKSLLRRLIGPKSQAMLGAGMAEGLADTVEARGLWARYGL
jgi:signal peptide peptidase SppA